jgi:hypothetical protein
MSEPYQLLPYGSGLWQLLRLSAGANLREWLVLPCQPSLQWCLLRLKPNVYKQYVLSGS